MTNQQTRYEQHPLARQLVPGTMPEEEFEAFCVDMKKRGQLVPITLFEGYILDGLNRYNANIRNGTKPIFSEYTGSDPAGYVIALNVLRRKLGTTQRALAGARLSLDHGLTQDQASKAIGVSKVHINLVVQALNSKNARIIKMLENPDLTRAQLHEDLVECGIVRTPSSPLGQMSQSSQQTPPTTLTAAAAGAGLEGFFHKQQPVNEIDDGDDDIFADDDDAKDKAGVDLDAHLDAPPSANGKVLTSLGGMPVVGTKPTQPERRPKETAASQLAERFKGLSQTEQVSFVQLTWPLLRKLLKSAGIDTAAEHAAEVAGNAISKASTAKLSRSKVVHH